MATLGFENYMEPLRLYLQKYRHAEVCVCVMWWVSGHEDWWEGGWVGEREQEQVQVQQGCEGGVEEWVAEATPLGSGGWKDKLQPQHGSRGSMPNSSPSTHCSACPTPAHLPHTRPTFVNEQLGGLLCSSSPNNTHTPIHRRPR